MADRTERARISFDQQAWSDAYAGFSEVAGRSSLDAADLERMAVCAYMLGEDEASVEAWTAAHHRALEVDDPGDAARCAFWLGFCLMLQGRMAQAQGWLTRAAGLVEDRSLDCVASGYLMIPGLLQAIDAGEPVTAVDLAVRATETGERFADADLRAFATLGHGQALIASGDREGGTARLDEAMVAVTAGEVGAIAAGVVYCAVILECVRLFDVPRASEWTAALSDWCDAQPDLVPYRGQCLVHRSQLQQAAGDWPEASSTADAALGRLTDPPHPALGMACYQRAELHRLVGALDRAEAEYREASRRGYEPMPGLALLELARGDGDAATSTIRRALSETADPLDRPALLAAGVDILRADGDVPGARAAAEELSAISSRSPSEVLAAMAAQGTGAVRFSEGDHAAALVDLRRAASLWAKLHMPYEGARAAVLIGLACSALGDAVSATLEYDNARDAFVALGARPDLDRLDRLAPESPPAGAGGAPMLSDREREVLAHVARGETNPQIAEALVISQHTVGRHLENIFAKLGVNSRAAATAHAYQHDLL